MLWRDLFGGKCGVGGKNHGKGPGERTTEVVAVENLMDLTHILEQAAAGLGSGLGIRCADDGCRGFKDDS